MQKGKVYLVGAGPGDYKLITLRGLELIRKADVLVYDRLASRKLLGYRSPHCELIDAGKKPDYHTLKQDEINDVLIQKALEGKMVVRLKGGDPYIFGRGGEEGEYLRSRNIEFEEVPGISSFYACPAYGGIPVTHRSVSKCIHVITGHEEESGNGIDFSHLAKLEGTLIFLMGMKNIKTICEELTAYGKDSATPAAVIHWGTTSKQKTAVGTLEDIEQKAKEHHITSPSVIIIGEVVRLRESLNWFETKPLFGKRILVTRATAQAGTLADKIEELGGEAVEIPVIRIEKPSDYTSIDRALHEIEAFSWIFFTSVNGVHGFFERMRQLEIDIRKLAGVKIFAMGPRTKECIRDFGLNIDMLPGEYNSQGAGAILEKVLTPEDKVLIPTSQLGGQELVDQILQKGATAVKAQVYTTMANRDENDELLEEMRKEAIDIITFASSSAVENFVNIAGTNIGKAKICSIGPKTTQTAERLGLKVEATAREATIDGLVDTILNICKTGL